MREIQVTIPLREFVGRTDVELISEAVEREIGHGRFEILGTMTGPEVDWDDGRRRVASAVIAEYINPQIRVRRKWKQRNRKHWR